LPLSRASSRLVTGMDTGPARRRSTRLTGRVIGAGPSPSGGVSDRGGRAAGGATAGRVPPGKPAPVPGSARGQGAYHAG